LLTLFPHTIGTKKKKESKDKRTRERKSTPGEVMGITIIEYVSPL
jgi:hypothetical protein